jgi:putative FmdB family regulatory protein
MRNAACPFNVDEALRGIVSMPTYDYVCGACQHRFEEFQSITAEALKKCPKCGREELRRLIGPGAAIVFKGSGFYATDYRSSSYRSAAASDNGSSSSGSNGKSSGGKTSSSAKSKSS